ncbi:MAG: hypothetical protein RQ847_01795 [Wenzhouxiangellaceae bacterium]|nr:hypothetical protein [Wenzhouxiangellaceae bacterium]
MLDSTPYFVGWGTLTLINAGLAQGKGRSGLAWWFISLFLGPIATFLIVVLSPPPASSSWHEHRVRAQASRGINAGESAP